MSLTRRLLGSCLTTNSLDGSLRLDVQSFINKLLLFDTFVIRSQNFKEVKHFVELFGYENTLLLLKSGAVKISSELRVVGQSGQSGFLAPGEKNLPLLSYSVLYGYEGNRKEWVSVNLKNLESLNLPKNKYKKLKLAVVEALEANYVQNTSDELLQQTKIHLQNNLGIKLATSLLIEKEQGIKLGLRDFTLRLHRTDDNVFEADTNLGEILSLDREKEHRIVERGILGVASLNQRCYEMKVHNALTGFLENEISILENKLGFLLRDQNSEKWESNLQNIIQVRHLPTFSVANKSSFSLARLLEVRQSPEIIAFREWIKDLPDSDDAEVSERLDVLRSQLGKFIQSDSGKVARFATNAVLGAVNPFLGLGAGVIDTFLLENLLPYSGTLAFLDNQYPSLFQS